jgi:hypothetical protein
MSLTDTTSGRDEKGRFAKGNPGGPGNPYTRQTAQLRQAVLETMNETEVRLITQRLLTLALQGDLQAIKLVLAYAIGKPDKVVNPDEVDRLEWELRQRLSVPADDIEELTQRVPARQANAVAEATRQAIALQAGQDIFQRLLKRGLLPQAMQPDAQPPAPRPGVRGGNKGEGGARR